MGPLTNNMFLNGIASLTKVGMHGVALPLAVITSVATNTWNGGAYLIQHRNAIIGTISATSHAMFSTQVRQVMTVTAGSGTLILFDQVKKNPEIPGQLANAFVDRALVPAVEVAGNAIVSSSVKIAATAGRLGFYATKQGFSALREELPSRNDTMAMGVAIFGAIKEKLPEKDQALEALRVPVGYLLEGAKDVVTLAGGEVFKLLPSRDQVVHATREGTQSLVGTVSEAAAQSTAVVLTEVKEAFLPSAQGMVNFFSSKPRAGTKGLEKLAYEQFEKISAWSKNITIPAIPSNWIPSIEMPAIGDLTASIEMPNMEATVITGLVAAAAFYALYRYKNSAKKVEVVAEGVITPKKPEEIAAAANKSVQEVAAPVGTKVSKDVVGNPEVTLLPVSPPSTSASKPELASASMPELIPVDGIIPSGITIIPVT